jgi:CDP-diacylglycerol--glycerol-3-phosphate 3-phosphatidyltransferase
MGRILCVPLLIWMLSPHFPLRGPNGEQELFTSLFFILVSISDGVDGYLARRRGQITTIGMLLDPLADKLLIVSALIALMQLNPRLVSAWVVIVVIARELLVTELRMVAAAEGITIQARDLGKWKMAVQVVAVLASILDHRWPAVHFDLDGFLLSLNIELIAKISILLMVGMSIASAADYFVTFWTKIDKAHLREKSPVRTVPARAANKLSSIQSEQRLPLR